MVSNFPQITYIYNRYNKDTTKQKASVEIRIYYNNKQKYISTGIRLFAHQWQNGFVINTPDSLQLNQKLNKMMSDVRQITMQMAEEGYIDIFAIPKRLKMEDKSKLSFIDFCQQRANIRKYGKKKDTQERYERFLGHLKEWGGMVEFEDITEQNIIKYDIHLTKKRLKFCSKWHNYHRFLNSFIIDAINEGLLTRNPYKWVNINKGTDTDSLHKHLTPAEFNKLKNATMPTASIDRVRDLFIFQTYTCLSYSDLKRFDSSCIQKVKKMKVYVGDRQKTGKEFAIPLLPTALSILEKYKGNLPIISNVKYNEYLKVVALAAGIDKPLSSHWARHTGATMLLNEGVDMKVISKICGHSSTKITEQIYAKLLNETVVDAIQEVSDKIE